MAKRQAYMIQETLHGKWFNEDGVDGEHWVDQNMATIWIGVENHGDAYDTMVNIMMGRNGFARNNYVKVVEFDYAAPKPGEFA